MTSTQQLVSTFFKNDNGDPFFLTASQDEIFQAIFSKKHPRLFITAWSQHGKSDVASMAILTRICAYPEKFAIVAPTNKKAGIIMGYLIDHAFDNPITLNKLNIGKEESLERIKRERNKSHLTFKHSKGMGEVMTLSAEGRRTKDVLGQLLGFGAKNVLIDESPLLGPEHYTAILRMLGGHKDNMLVEIGNAINRNHFYKSSRDSNYHHIVIPYEAGVSEGRQTQQFFDEMKRKMNPQMFASLYECKFPDSDAIDADGYSPLVAEAELDRAKISDIQFFGELRMGVDVAGGGRNKSAIVLRGSNGAKILFSEETKDTMSLVGIILRYIKEYKVLPQNVFIDIIGVGKGVFDRLREEGHKVTGVNVGVAPETDGYANLKAEACWRLAEDVRSGKLKLVDNPAWEQILFMRYKIQSDKKLKIIGKEELLERGIQSPDEFEALMLTYCRKRRVDIDNTLSTAAWKALPQFQKINEFG